MEAMSENMTNNRPLSFLILIIFLGINAIFNLVSDFVAYNNVKFFWLFISFITNGAILFSIFGIFKMKKRWATLFPILYLLLLFEHIISGASTSNIYLELTIPLIYFILIPIYWKRFS